MSPFRLGKWLVRGGEIKSYTGGYINWYSFCGGPFGRIYKNWKHVCLLTYFQERTLKMFSTILSGSFCNSHQGGGSSLIPAGEWYATVLGWNSMQPSKTQRYRNGKILYLLNEKIHRNIQPDSMNCFVQEQTPCMCTCVWEYIENGLQLTCWIAMITSRKESGIGIWGNSWKELERDGGHFTL